jgi:hypothetical protein
MRPRGSGILQKHQRAGGCYYQDSNFAPMECMTSGIWGSYHSDTVWSGLFLSDCS